MRQAINHGRWPLSGTRWETFFTQSTNPLDFCLAPFLLPPPPPRPPPPGLFYFFFLLFLFFIFVGVCVGGGSLPLEFFRFFFSFFNVVDTHSSGPV